VLARVLVHHPHRPRTHLARIPVARLLRHRSTFSRVGASGKPGAVQNASNASPSSCPTVRRTAGPRAVPTTPPPLADQLPLPPNLCDQALLIHALDTADSAQILAEVWRILAPAGELLLIVPNRLDRLFAPASPFAMSEAYNDTELATLLEAARFEVRSQHTALGRLAPRARLALAVKTDGLAPMLVGRAETVRAAPALGEFVAGGLVPA